jgi:uncharacterized protein YhhL (DUF1145 family)
MLSYLQDLWKFLVALVTNFSNQLTGGVIIAALTLYFGLLKKASPSPEVYKVLVVMFGVFACFNVWRAEYRKTSPGLRLHLDQFGFAETAQKAPGVPLVDAKGITAIVSATLRNLGPATIADAWVLTIKLPGQKEILRPRLMDFNLPFGPSINIHGAIVPINKLLYKQTMAPIDTGDKREGILAFFVDNKTMADVQQIGMKMTLSCRDIAGNEIYDVGTWNGTGGKFRHSIGLES